MTNKKRLVIPVNGIYFDQMQEGSKVFEFRLRNAYWSKRLVGQQYDEVVITRGYPSKTEYSKRLVLPYLGYEEQAIKHPHFGAESVDVFAIRIDIKQRVMEGLNV